MARHRQSRLRTPPDQPVRGRPDLNFRYDRQERLAMRTAPKQSPQQGFFRRYRGVLIIFADIVLLVVLGFIFYSFFGPPDSTARIGAYRATLRALQYGELLLVTVSLSGETGTESPGGGERRVYVRFALRRNAAEADCFFDSAALPEDGQVVLRASLPVRSSAERVYADVRIGEHSGLLSMPLER